MERESLACDIDRILRKLDDRKREILKMYYWLGWYKKLDIEDIAYTFWVMIPAIRQQRLRALEIIREEIIPDLLKKYL
jgi:DNA-directed RNA polymerase sigma subunit (sigma70/sigma32)